MPKKKGAAPRRKPTGEKHKPQRPVVKHGAKKFRTGSKIERQEGSRILNDEKNDPLPAVPVKRTVKRTTKRVVTRARKRTGRR